MKSDSSSRTVVLAPDSFKGSLSAVEVAEALAEGWRSRRPQDVLVLLPQADGGEGTAEAIASATPGSAWRSVGDVCGPDGRPTDGRWLLLPDGTAVIELAQVSGLPLMSVPDPLGASTFGLGQVIARALHSGAKSLVIALGGSASTDGGAGVMRALGALLLDDAGEDLADGGGALVGLRRLDLSGLVLPPEGGVQLLVDTRAVLHGPGGAVDLFAEQKGANAAQRCLLEEALARWAWFLGDSAVSGPTVTGLATVDTPGAGAAGGTGYALAMWGGKLVPGAARVAELTGLPKAIASADVVVTGEGRFDRTSRSGKLVGSVLELSAAAETLAVVVAGAFGMASGAIDVSLTDLAGGRDEAIAHPRRWCIVAGAAAATAAAGGSL